MAASTRSAPDHPRRPRWVLGVNPGPHDGAAALLRDGQLVVMAEQERFSRNKSARWEAPLDAIAACLHHAGIGLDGLAGIGLGCDLRLLDPAERAAFGPLDAPEVLFPPERFPRRRLPPVHRFRHHLAHAASAFRASGFPEAAVVTIDDRGEDCSAAIAHGTPEGITVLAALPVWDSLGLFYRTACEYAGLGRLPSQSGKLMGLAAYGAPTQPVPLTVRDGWPCFDLPAPAGATPEDRRQHRRRQLLDAFTASCSPYQPGLAGEPMAYASFAASAQLALEEAVEALCRAARARTGSRRLCLAGGVALNCTANGRVARAGLFDQVFIQPAAYDAGTALGAALELDAQLTGHPTPPEQAMTHAYFGPASSDATIAAELGRAGLRAARLSERDLVEQVARLLAGHAVVGWFQGRAEVGPRALGARSLLANPAHRATLTRVNQLKGREPWRPLAPSVTAEAFARYFTGPPSPFMLIACHARPEHAPRLQAVLHVDGSTRPQAVTRQANPRFWHLLRAVERHTGDPVVLNTSYNLAGEPIVNTPAEAIRDFLAAPIDALAIGNYLARKTGAQYPGSTSTPG